MLKDLCGGKRDKKLLTKRFFREPNIVHSLVIAFNFSGSGTFHYPTNPFQTVLNCGM